MTRRWLGRAFPVIAGSILFTAFALYPALTMPLGDRFETSQRRSVERGGCRGIQLVVASDQMADLGRVTIKTDGRTLTWTSINRQRDFDRHLLELRFAEEVPRGAEIEVEGPFSLYYRPLYWPASAERVVILIERLSLWLPYGGLALLGTIIAFAFSASGILLIAFSPAPVVEVIRSDAKMRKS